MYSESASMCMHHFSSDLYYYYFPEGVSVETRDVEEKNKAHEQERLPKNYSTCYQLYLQFQDLHKLISQFSEELKQLFIGM